MFTLKIQTVANAANVEAVPPCNSSLASQQPDAAFQGICLQRVRLRPDNEDLGSQALRRR